MTNTLTKFEKGKRYRFSATLTQERARELNLEIFTDWISDICDGAEVEVLDEYLATVDGYRISPSFCVEI